MKKLNKIGKVLIAILTYFVMVIDRIVLIPFLTVTSYSVFDLQKAPDRFSAHVITRVSIALIVTTLILLLKLIF